MFKNGKLKQAVAVDIVGERCNHGIKELLFQPSKADSEVVWKSSRNLPYSLNPKVMDPHERKSVYVANSTAANAKEGLFAKRKFFPGDLVSFYGGERRNAIFGPESIRNTSRMEEIISTTMYRLALTGAGAGIREYSISCSF